MIWSALSLCLFLSFVLSGLESALLSVSLVRVRHSAGESRPRFGARWLARAFAHRERLLSAVLLLNDVVILLAFAIVTRELVARFGGLGYLLAFAVSLPVYLFVFELVPKSLFERFPYRLLRFFVPFLWCVENSLGRLLSLASVLPRSLFLGDRVDDEGSADRPESAAATVATSERQEFRSLTDVIARQGLIGPSETRLIGSILDFPRIEIASIMIPLARVTTVPLDLPARQVIALSRKERVDQFPVVAPDGSMVGLVNVFELLRHSDPTGTVVRFMRRLVRAHPNDAARDVLIQLRATGVQLAAVSDHAGTLLGIVSAEDIIARLLDGEP